MFAVPLLTAVVLCTAKSAHSFCVTPGWCLLQHAQINGTTIEAKGPIFQDIDPYVNQSTRVKIVDRKNVLSNNDTSTFVHVVPSQGQSNCDNPQRGIFIYKEPYYPANGPHTLGDDVIVMFRLLYFWGLHYEHPKTVHIVMPADWDPAIGDITHHDLYRVISENPILRLDHSLPPPCFENLLVGFETNSNFNNRIKFTMPEILAFRERALRSASVVPAIHETSTMCEVAFIQKDVSVATHNYSIANVDEIVSVLRQQLKCTVDVLMWSRMSFREQLQAISDKTVAIALPGSDLMNCFFMPPNSAIISAERFCDLGCRPVGTDSGSVEIDRMFAMAPFHRFVLYRMEDDTGKNFQWSSDFKRLTWNPAHMLEAVRNATHAIRSGVILSNLEHVSMRDHRRAAKRTHQQRSLKNH